MSTGTANSSATTLIGANTRRPRQIGDDVRVEYRRRWILIGIGGGLAAALFGAVAVRANKPPPWMADLDRGFPRIEQLSPSFLPESRDRQMFIRNELLRRPLWDVKEVEYLRAIIRVGYPRPFQEGNLNREEMSLFFDFTASTLAMDARILTKAPISVAARELIIQTMVNELEAEFPERRRSAADSLLEYGAVEHPKIRAAVERLFEDEDEQTAQTVASHVASYDRRRKQHENYALKARSAADDPR